MQPGEDIHLGLPFLTPEKREELTKLFAETDRTWMPHEIADKVGIEYEDANALLMALDMRGALRLNLLIYHCSEAPVGSRPFADGFPPLPFSCPECQTDVTDPAELSYDLEAYIPRPIRLL